MGYQSQVRNPHNSRPSDRRPKTRLMKDIRYSIASKLINTIGADNMIQGMGMTRKDDNLFRHEIRLASRILNIVENIAEPIRTKSAMQIK